jgi:hypothetical protein
MAEHSPSPTDAGPLVVAWTQDLFFGVRIEDISRRVGARLRLVGSAGELAAALAEGPALVLIELGAGDAGWHEVVRGFKGTASGQRSLVVAFGSHLDVAARRAARQAGSDHVWAKSHLTAELPALLARASAYAQGEGRRRGGDGCDDALPAEASRGFAEFNRGEYFAQHETLEGVWFAEKRPVRDLYQGILQLGLACYHVEQGNWRGAVKMLRRALPRLARLPEVCQGVQVETLRQAGEAMLAELTRLGPERIAELDRRLFPRILWQASYPPGA